MQLNEFQLGHDRFAGKRCKSVNGKIGVRVKRDFRSANPVSVTVSRLHYLAILNDLDLFPFVRRRDYLFRPVFIRYMNFSLFLFVEIARNYGKAAFVFLYFFLRYQTLFLYSRFLKRRVDKQKGSVKSIQ